MSKTFDKRHLTLTQLAYWIVFSVALVMILVGIGIFVTGGEPYCGILGMVFMFMAAGIGSDYHEERLP